MSNRRTGQPTEPIDTPTAQPPVRPAIHPTARPSGAWVDQSSGRPADRPTERYCDSEFARAGRRRSAEVGLRRWSRAMARAPRLKTEAGLRSSWHYLAVVYIACGLSFVAEVRPNRAPNGPVRQQLARRGVRVSRCKRLRWDRRFLENS